jgi:hypothetical protein
MIIISKSMGVQHPNNCINFKFTFMDAIEKYVQENQVKVFFIILLICIFADNF